MVSGALGRQISPGMALPGALGRQVGAETAVSGALGRQVGPGWAKGQVRSRFQDRFWGFRVIPVPPKSQASCRDFCIDWNSWEFIGIHRNFLEQIPDQGSQIPGPRSQVPDPIGIYWNLLELIGIYWNLLEFI